jgi:hypothetical protein
LVVPSGVVRDITEATLTTNDSRRTVFFEALQTSLPGLLVMEPGLRGHRIPDDVFEGYCSRKNIEVAVINEFLRQRLCRNSEGKLSLDLPVLRKPNGKPSKTLEAFEKLVADSASIPTDVVDFLVKAREESRSGGLFGAFHHSSKESQRFFDSLIKLNNTPKREVPEFVKTREVVADIDQIVSAFGESCESMMRHFRNEAYAGKASPHLREIMPGEETLTAKEVECIATVGSWNGPASVADRLARASTRGGSAP